MDVPWPAASHVWPISAGIPGWWRTRCWTGLSTRTIPDVPARSNARCSFGAQVSPHLLSSCWHTGGFPPLKGFMFGHMVLHFHLFWQSDLNYQPISAPRLCWFRKRKEATAKPFRLCRCSMEEHGDGRNEKKDAIINGNICAPLICLF